MPPALPSSIEDVTPEWMTEAVRSAGHLDDATITKVKTEQIGAGIGVASSLYRAHLDYEPPGAGPDRVIVKLPALDEAAHFTSTILRMYEREVRFFEEIAPTCPIRVPACYYGDIDDEGAQYVVVMQDMGEMRVVDQVAGCGPDDAQLAVDELAGLHGQWWGREEEVSGFGAVVRIDDPLYPTILPAVFAEGWEKVTSELDVVQPILEVGPRFGDAIEGIMVRLAQPPVTFVHGDYRADNMLFDPDTGELVLLDFQLGGLAVGSYDLAYFITQSVTSATRSANETAWIDRYCAGLAAAGADEVERDRVWDDYRWAALFCLVYPIVAARGMDFDNPRERALVDAMNDRFGTALVDLDLAELI